MRHELSSYSDQALFSEMALGNEEAFEVFFYRYNTKAYHFILHIVKNEEIAEELIHDVFLKLWLSKETLRQVVNPGNYLFVAAKNLSLNQLEKLSTGRRVNQPLEDQTLPERFTPEEQLSYKESLALIAQAVQKLPEQQKLVFQLTNQQGLSRDEIALRLNVSPHTVKNHLGSARKSIQRYMLAHGKIVGGILVVQIFLGSH
jgi:RNA polymerase sigma-70 factor (ECF subfamily)